MGKSALEAMLERIEDGDISPVDMQLLIKTARAFLGIYNLALKRTVFFERPNIQDYGEYAVGYECTLNRLLDGMERYLPEIRPLPTIDPRNMEDLLKEWVLRYPYGYKISKEEILEKIGALVIKKSEKEKANG